MTTYVYRSGAADILAEHDAFQAEHRAWAKAARKLVDGWFPGDKRQMLVQRGWGRERWVGISGRWSERNDLPEGWRYDKNNEVCPFKSRKEGKALAKVMDACQPPAMLTERLRGMPGSLFGGKYGFSRYTPGVEILAGKMYVSWAVELEPEDYDPKVWKRVRLSEYHRLREAEGKTS